ncbi:CapA family protein [Candidatus Poriferisodalis sp.]|uniref:CapA family protein n=1 Tax=Candidatus Poriferisodalis sp. TaxID=3101277 RepID=UPI003B52901C
MNGIVIGHLSYTYGLNDIPLPSDGDWAVDVIDPDAIAAEAQAAVAAGAEFVILSIRWGAEYTSVPSASQRRLANNLLADSGIGPNRRGVLERSWQRTAGVLRAEGVDVVIEGDPAGTQAISGAPDIPSVWPLARR